MLLRDYLVQLSTDGNKLRAFKENPAKSLSDAGLQPAEKKAVMDGDVTALRKMLGKTSAAGAGDDIAVVVVVVIANPALENK